MTKKNVNKKLNLNKETLCTLNDKEMNIIQGGATNGGAGCTITSTVTINDC